MVKVYLVEDEIIIRQSIKNSIDWEKEGYEFVGDASDGELALAGDFEGEAGYSDHRYPYAVYGWTGVKPYG